MQIKKLSAIALSALMATTAMLPMSAFATQQPGVEYTGGDGSEITHLYLIADDTNLANNNTVEYNQLNAKVQVPVAINYVAEADGDILGPADEQAQIRNFSGFPVNVANIKVNAGTNVTLVNTAEAADTADEIYLQMKPNSGTVVAMADFTASATESTTNANDGTGKRPDAGAEWNIAAAQSGVGTASAVASVLNLNSLSGKIGGFNNLDPAQKQEIGQIEWTVKPGVAPEPTTSIVLPEQAAAGFSDDSTITISFIDPLNDHARNVSTTMALLQTASDDIAQHGSSSAYYDTFDTLMKADATFGFTPADGDSDAQTINARIIGINHDTEAGETGLTFMAKHSLNEGFFINNTYSAVQWADSSLRQELLGTYTGDHAGELYALLPDTLKTAAKNVTKYNNTSDGSGTALTGTSTTDKFWVISYRELVGDGFDQRATMNQWDAGTGNHQYAFFINNYPEKVTTVTGVVDAGISGGYSTVIYDGETYTQYEEESGIYYGSGEEFLVIDNAIWTLRKTNVALLKDMSKTIDDTQYVGPSGWNTPDKTMWRLRSADNSNNKAFTSVRSVSTTSQIAGGQSVILAQGIVPCFCL